MFHRQNRRISGFTLVELAIVLGVAGVLFGGLWRLLSTSNQQMRDQATAAQHAQLIAAVNAYLQSPGAVASTTGGGQGFLTAMAADGVSALTLPSTAAAAAGNAACLTNLAATNPGLCAFLPGGFWAQTTNPYGQRYMIQIRKDGTPLGRAPASYSFMVITTNTVGDTISDTSGGRISAMIGGDGGFIYNTNVCGAVPATVCGSYGAWSATPATAPAATNPTFYGFAAANLSVGHIATRTFYSTTQNVSDTWLARKFVTGDNAATGGGASPIYNTMQTPLFFGGQSVYFGSASVAPPALPAANTMYLGADGMILGATSATSGGGNITLNGDMDNGGPLPNAVFKLQSNCSSITAGPFTGSGTCGPIMQINGDANIVGQFQATSFYSAAFVYNSTSDVRLKKNIQPLSNALADVMKIKPVSFVFKSDNKKSMGVIAQDLEKVYPDLVQDGRTGYKAVAYEGLIAPLVAAVQELKKENDKLRAQLQDQFARQEKMERDLGALRKK